jgi:cell division protein FtsZ
MFEFVEKIAPNAVIKVVGVGGGGGNAVAHMVNSQVEGVEFICANTDAQAIKGVGAKSTLQLGVNVTKGLGAGANPEVGRQAALEDRERIVECLEGADMVFITAGMGGGTGTGAAPVVAQLAKEMGVLTVAVVTKPFPFEGRRRMQVALKGIDELAQHCDSLITIPNEKLITVLGREATMVQAFRAANDVLQGAVQGIADLIVRPGLINVDFADVRTVMSEMGMAMMGSGHARGDDRSRSLQPAARRHQSVRRLRHPGQHHCRPRLHHARVRRGRSHHRGVLLRGRHRGDRHRARPRDAGRSAGDRGRHRAQPHGQPGAGTPRQSRRGGAAPAGQAGPQRDHGDDRRPGHGPGRSRPAGGCGAAR